MITGIYAVDLILQIIGIWAIAAFIFTCIWMWAMGRRDRIEEENRRLWDPEACYRGPIRFYGERPFQ